jgi:hypothetical protein
MLRGRDIADADAAGAPRVALVNASLAARSWPHVGAVGRRLTFDNPESPAAVWWTVVGVVSDVRNRRLDRPAGPTVYLPFAQAPGRTVTVALRSPASRIAMSSQVRDAVHAGDPQLPVSLRELAGRLDSELARPRLNSLLLALFATAALLLGAVGIFAVMSFAVSQRADEMAIRSAIGARRLDISALVLRRAVVLALAGLAVGFAAALAVGRLLSSVLYGVGTADSAVLTSVAALIVAVALAASSLPAWRATRLEPRTTLRAE